jgi:competence protein ComEA
VDRSTHFRREGVTQTSGFGRHRGGVTSLEIPRRAVLAVGLVVLVALALAGTRLVRSGAAEAPRRAAPLAPAAAAPQLLVVHVVGAVRRPGLYRLPEEARVADAVARAGGTTRRADVAAVNLAAPLADGAQVLVPARPVPGAAAAASRGSSAASTRVSLATATVEQLDELPGIGPVTAEKIVDWRTAHGPFRSVDDLDAVPGIGPTRVEQLREHVTP